MRVKRLEIQGFKSFKDKTVIHFDHKITGIVGPNGCGKSNIVDAFFWVMGEQSYKHMRGSSSDDLIFNGSSKYSPLGMAEATMVLETDVVDPTQAPAGASASPDLPVQLKTKEISVTRRLYRTGEGEYLINGTVARLKDIHELFMDTGVGAKGYSVIEQGQIGKIVNAKPEDRRLLVEEAAGIAKYKARKKESLRKMEATHANLARLTDIIQEIEKNLNSLEKQAHKAQLYRKYKDELQSKEMTWGKRKAKSLTDKLETLKKQKESLEQELVGLRAELQVAENSIEVDRVEQVTETKEAETLQAEIQDLSAQLSRQQSALDLSRRRQGDLTSQLEALEIEKVELQGAIETDRQRLEESKVQADEAQMLFQTASTEVKNLNDIVYELRKSVQTARGELDSTQRELMLGVNQASQLTSKSAGLNSKAEAAKAQVNRLLAQAEESEQRVNEIREELESLRSQAEELRENRESLNLEKKEQSSKVQTEEQKLRQMEREKDQSLRSLTQLKSKLQSLEELDQSREGMADGPKAVLDWAEANQFQGQVGALTDQIEITSGFDSVVENWLENRLETLFTVNHSVALQSLDTIRNDKQGRAAIRLLTVQPSHQVKTASFEEIKPALETQGFQVIGPLKLFVKSNNDGLSQFFENVCVVETLKPLTSEELNLKGWALVSQDGMALDFDGVLRGGSLGTSGAAAVLRRKRSIEELKIQVAQAEDAYQAVEQSVSSTKQSLDLSKARLQSLQADLQALEIQLAGLDRDIHQTDKAAKEAQSQQSRISDQVEDLNQEAEQALTDREVIEAQLQEILSSRSEVEEKIKQFELNVSEKDAQLQTQESELQTLRVKEASLKERSSSLKREIDSTQSLLSDRERRLSEVNRTLDRASNEQAEFSGGETELVEKIEELTRSLFEAREKLASVKDLLEQSNSKVSHLMEKIKILHKSGDQKTAETNQLALDIEKLSGELAHLIQNLEEKYGPGCLYTTPVSGEIDAPATELTPEETTVLTEEVEKLRERIRRLGEVNVMAIEEFELLKKRHDYLLTEKADLEKSIGNLQEAIDHINKTSEERFRKAFQAIADRFERLFPIIFGGGQAKLSLVYPENSTDILEAGVDILAQPPGKKVANITLLSGGEKALTAVSLIFAIFMVKPSPFCVLDEVDAPLDDANIGKFNALLREMSVKSQFILITHNKKTMELNDTLYGVTMEEPGVSKMVSIEMH